jgi:hypothetical protein
MKNGNLDHRFQKENIELKKHHVLLQGQQELAFLRGLF